MLKGLRSYLRFYRHHTASELRYARASFSQFGEDLYLVEQFPGKSHGVYVEVGAFHPMQYSNSYLFYRGGWRGLAIEPQPHLADLYARCRPRDEVVRCAITDTEGETDLLLFDGQSGIDDGHYMHDGQQSQLPRIRVQTRRLTSVFAASPLLVRNPIDFLSVDCEGHDEVVLASNDWNRWRPLIVLCEAYTQGVENDLEGAMVARGYRRIGKCGPTLVYRDLNSPLAL